MPGPGFESIFSVGTASSRSTSVGEICTRCISPFSSWAVATSVVTGFRKTRSRPTGERKFSNIVWTVAAVIILGWDIHRADPAISLLIGVLVLWAAWRLLRDTTHVLLEAAPRGGAKSRRIVRRVTT